MYKLLIVEDEDIIRQGLVSTIDWNRWGFAICGVATDGLEGLEMTAKLQPNLIITDIRMPQMSGIDLLRHVKTAWPHIQIILLTGYEQFEYAYEGVNLHAVAYILKVDIRKALTSAMEAAVQAIEHWNIIEHDTEFSPFSYPEIMAGLEKDIAHAIQMLDTEKLDSVFNLWMNEWNTGQAPVAVMRERAMRLCNEFSPAIQGMSISTLAGITDRHGLEATVWKLYDEVKCYMADQNKSAQKKYIAFSIDYIDTHLDERVKISDVAQALYLNPSYLSVLFREHTGKTFTDYMVEQKMNKAAALLRGGASVMEAASSVGYLDISHFRSMYNKFIGQSPSQSKCTKN